MPLSFDFTEEQELFRRTVREFAKKEIAPKIREYDRKREFPWDVYRKMGNAGLLGLRFGKEYGGQGADAVTMGIAVEEVARAGWQIPLSDIMGEILELNGPEALKKEWLPAMARGERMLGVANTEPSAGSDAASITTRAARQGDNYVLNGEKQYITGVMEMGAFCILAKTDPDKGAKGVSMFFVEMNRPGIEKYEFHALGWKLFSFGGIVLKDVTVPASNLIGEENLGFRYVMETFDLMRALIAVWCIGIAESSLEEGIDYAKQRTAFGRPIAKFESVQSRIVEGYTELEAARLLTYRALWLKDQGKKITKESAMIKWYVPQLCFGIVNSFLQNRGALGYTTECMDEYRLRELRGAMIGDGTTDINKIVAARELLGREFLPYR
ncbi:MAG TPA: acyl-CoA dehydrogenase family protein [Terriglobales bacterium]|nr:acyl-CoA dehydrogenase family protein [Terriglobales bacterium]